MFFYVWILQKISHLLARIFTCSYMRFLNVIVMYDSFFLISECYIIEFITIVRCLHRGFELPSTSFLIATCILNLSMLTLQDVPDVFFLSTAILQWKCFFLFKIITSQIVNVGAVRLSGTQTISTNIN